MISWRRIALIVLAIGATMIALRSSGIIDNETPATIIITTVSLAIAVIGLELAYRSLTIAHNMQTVDEAREKKRSRVINEDEIPYVAYSLEILYASMIKTQEVIDEHMEDGKIKSKELCENVHKRARAHISAIWQIESKFVEAELSRYFVQLGFVIEHLEELGFITPDTEVNMEEFDDSIDAVLDVMTDMDSRSEED